MIHINDLFWTIQGEGANSGRRALFVRMPFCNLKCSWCDTQYNSFQEYTEKQLIDFATSESCRFAVITGGEPTMHKHTLRVIEVLKSLNFELAIESNGTFAVPREIDFVTISPKRDANYEVHPEAWNSADEFKYVIDEGFQWDILKRHKQEDGARLSLSPEFGRFEASIQEILNFIKTNPHWRISLQTHKWMKIA